MFKQRIWIGVLLMGMVGTLGLAPTPKEPSKDRAFVDPEMRDYIGVVGDFMSHSLKCQIRDLYPNFSLYFVVRDNVDPNTRGVLMTIPGLGQFYTQYWKLDQLWLVFEADSSHFSLDYPLFRLRVQRNKWSHL